MAYISPEQARGEEVDQRSDVWSLGVMLYEMLTGQLPFPGVRSEAIIHAILTAKPKPLKQLRGDAPAETERIVQHALEKDLRSRYASASEVFKDLTEYQSSLALSKTELGRWRLISGWIKQKRVAIPGLLILLILGSLMGWLFHRQAKISWARGEMLPKIQQLKEAGWEHYVEAYKLAVEAEKYLPRDPELSEFLSKIAVGISITTAPPGASIYMKEYGAPQSEWKYLGVSPIDKMRLPIGIFGWRMEKEGYETVFAASSTFEGLYSRALIPYNIVRVLDKKGSVPIGMVRVKGEKEIGDFFLDQYEVSNKQFKEFVYSGGYRQRKYWKRRFIKDGKELTWEEATKEFVDHTGQFGPASWQAGDYPEGQADYPVSGVSWYEAAAYAEFAGKSLPTASHWGIARGEYTPLVQNPFYSFLAPLSNFKGKGIAPVGSYPGMTPYGAYDMAGNVREWCWNESPNGRVIRGGTWDDPTYMFQELSQAVPFDRSPRNGFRCVLYLGPDKIPKSTFQRAKLPESPDFYKQKPVSDSIFDVYKEQFLYDKTDLNARVEERSESSKDWIQEKVTYNAAYDNERMIAYLFLPKRGLPPYQTIIYFPGAPALDQRSSKELDRDFYFDYHLSFIVKNGRAVLFPLYKGTFERGNNATARIFEGDGSSRQLTEILIKDFKDFKRSIDYLEIRPDIDSKRLAYTGFSWGAGNGAIILAVEDRLKASILYDGGMGGGSRPEVAQMNYVTHVRIPTLMLNGRYDMVVPYETSAKPMFDLLGTPKEQKEQKLYDSDHFIPRNELIKETLNWLDRYLGPVK
jgi:eukaryotic-like serine/threonine-protein kinase